MEGTYSHPGRHLFPSCIPLPVAEYAKVTEEPVTYNETSALLTKK